MITFLMLVFIIAPIILLFSDRAIENINPYGDLAKLSDETDNIMTSVNDNETAHVEMISQHNSAYLKGGKYA
ncbi:MAG: hypothetical protein H0U78_03430 [Rickettsiaceae bacterium]|nr:hypothetical protein [Rickettsiaceae bacterium]